MNMVERQMMSVRLSQETIDRLDVLAERLSRRAAGAKVGRSEAHRIALERGIATLLAELAPKAKKTPTK